MSIDTALVQILKDIAPNTTFILPYRNGVEPQSVYCLVMILSKENVGMNEQSMYNNNGKQQISQNMLCNARIQYFGDSQSSAQADAELMNMMLDTHLVRSKFYHKGLSIATVDSIKQAGVQRDTKYYMTHIMDLTILYKQTIEVDAQTIESVGTEATFKTTGAPDDLVVNYTTELP